jgi:hypothetical protein
MDQFSPLQQLSKWINPAIAWIVSTGRMPANGLLSGIGPIAVLDGLC